MDDDDGGRRRTTDNSALEKLRCLSAVSAGGANNQDLVFHSNYTSISSHLGTIADRIFC